MYLFVLQYLCWYGYGVSKAELKWVGRWVVLDLGQESLLRREDRQRQARRRELGVIARVAEV
jgi:hypothetical protein